MKSGGKFFSVQILNNPINYKDSESKELLAILKYYDIIIFIVLFGILTYKLICKRIFKGVING